MANNKNQHFVPQFYFKKFSKDKKTISIFNIERKKFISSATIKGQCSKNYFYSKNIQIEQNFSDIERLSNKLISKIIKNRNLSCLNKKEKQILKDSILFQHGRTEYIRESEEENANTLFDMLKPNYMEYAKEHGLDLVPEEVNKMRIKLNSQNSLHIAMISGPLLHDLKLSLLRNDTRIDFVFSDNPAVFFNSFFNNKVSCGTQGIASKGLQIYYPLNSKFALFIFDPNFYELHTKEVVIIKKESDIHKLNGLQILYCNENVYFENFNMRRNIKFKYNQIKSKIPSKKTESKIVESRNNEDGTCSEIWRISPTKINYDLEKLSIMKHKKNNSPYGIRNPKMLELTYKIINAISNGEISSEEDYNKFIRNNENLLMKND